MKVDPSKLTHNIKKIKEDDEPSTVTALTWQLDDRESDITKQRKGEFKVKGKKKKSIGDPNDSMKQVYEVLANDKKRIEERRIAAMDMEVVPVNPINETELAKRLRAITDKSKFDSDSDENEKPVKFGDKFIAMKKAAKRKKWERNVKLRESLKESESANTKEDEVVTKSLGTESTQLKKVKQIGKKATTECNTSINKTVEKVKGKKADNKVDTPNKKGQKKEILATAVKKNAKSVSNKKGPLVKNNNETLVKQNEVDDELQVADNESVSSADTAEFISRKRKIEPSVASPVNQKVAVKSWLNVNSFASEFSDGLEKPVKRWNQYPDSDDEVDDFEVFAKNELTKISRTPNRQLPEVSTMNGDAMEFEVVEAKSNLKNDNGAKVRKLNSNEIIKNKTNKANKNLPEQQTNAKRASSNYTAMEINNESNEDSDKSDDDVEEDSDDNEEVVDKENDNEEEMEDDSDDNESDNEDDNSSDDSESEESDVGVNLNTKEKSVKTDTQRSVESNIIKPVSATMGKLSKENGNDSANVNGIENEETSDDDEDDDDEADEDEVDESSDEDEEESDSDDSEDDENDFKNLISEEMKKVAPGVTTAKDVSKVESSSESESSDLSDSESEKQQVTKAIPEVVKSNTPMVIQKTDSSSGSSDSSGSDSEDEPKKALTIAKLIASNKTKVVNEKDDDDSSSSDSESDDETNEAMTKIDSKVTIKNKIVIEMDEDSSDTSDSDDEDESDKKMTTVVSKVESKPLAITGVENESSSSSESSESETDDDSNDGEAKADRVIEMKNVLKVAEKDTVNVTMGRKKQSNLLNKTDESSDSEDTSGDESSDSDTLQMKTKASKVLSVNETIKASGKSDTVKGADKTEKLKLPEHDVKLTEKPVMPKGVRNNLDRARPGISAEDADKKRLDTLKQKKQENQTQKSAIQKALAGIVRILKIWIMYLWIPTILYFYRYLETVV